jgi:phage gp46-like protein
MIIKIADDGSAKAEMILAIPTEDDSLMTDAYSSIMVQQGSWFFDLTFGSRLHLLSRVKNTEHAAALAEEYTKEALQWLINIKKLMAVNVVAIRAGHRLQLFVTMTKPNGKLVSFSVFTEVV